MATEYPDDLRYTKDHEWARINGKSATIGITAFAIHSLGDITQVDLPKEKETFKREQSMGTVESVKTVSDIYAPLSGTVVKTNDPLKDSPETLNEDCYDEGWLVEMELSNPAEVDQLMTSDEYQKYLKEQA